MINAYFYAHGHPEEKCQHAHLKIFQYRATKSIDNTSNRCTIKISARFYKIKPAERIL